MPLIDIGEPVEPDLLDEEDEFDEFDKAEDDYDARMNIFSLCWKNFCDTFKRKPNTDKEFQDRLLTSYGAKFTLEEIKYFKERRSAWVSSGRGKMAKPGLSHPSFRTNSNLEDLIDIDYDPRSF